MAQGKQLARGEKLKDVLGARKVENMLRIEKEK